LAFAIEANSSAATSARFPRTASGVLAERGFIFIDYILVYSNIQINGSRACAAALPGQEGGSMTSFTPWASLLGGILIGLSAVLLMASQGRIAGISGIASRLFPPYEDDGFLGRLAFVLGLVAAPFAVAAVTGETLAQTVSPNLPLMAVAGLFVGFGTVWGNGCTSGHGVCGIARLSRRSIAATLIFMAVGVATVFIARHLIGG
jgi:uncharacterized membrane protein YedE/YeeE